ncbi:MAG: FG-GAP-like repeat-containing protein, partial [Deltaproteobacteria bacterium]|nr:FG-GAP-like repeat-containing protein [Deltaproteobacteria bacterium]
GCEQPRTELVVRVDTEVAWGAGQRVQSVVLAVRRGGPTGPLRSARTTALGEGGERRALPLLVGVIAADGDVETPVWIEALGCGDPNGCSAAGAVVAQRAVVRFARGQTEELPLLLASACVGVACADDQRCAADIGRCEAATRAQAMVRPFNGSDAATAVMDAGAAADVTDADAPDVRDTGSDVVSTPDVAAMDLPDVVDVPVMVDLGTSPVDRPMPADTVLPPSDDGGIMCPSGQTPCVSTCRDLAVDRANCGACNRACAASESCTAGACVGPVTPRPIAPLSTAIVTSRRPLLRWALASGTDGAAVEICRDRACTGVVTSFSVSGDRGAPTVELPAGVLFWRLRGRTSGVTDARYSPTWQFTVGARSAPVNASSGTVPDFNGDGFADVVVGGFRANRVFVYSGGSGGVVPTPATTLVAPSVGDRFGISLASAGDVNGDGYADLVVGTENSRGQAYVFLGGAGGLAAAPATTLNGSDGLNTAFGRSVAGAGDVNGDGYADLVVGAYGEMASAGRAYIYLGSIGGISTTPTSTLLGPDGASGAFGWSVASAGDIDGDGYADLVIGAHGAMSYRGRTYVYLGSAGGPSATPSSMLVAPDGGSFGFSVASAGDVNGYGYADIGVGGSGGTSGYAYVYLGGVSGLTTTPASRLTGPASTLSLFGRSLASAGDVNGDGYADLIVGDPGSSSTQGRAYVYLGAAGGLGTTSASTLSGTDDLGDFGRSVAGAGDVDGDGYADVIVGDPEFMNNTGQASIYLGSAGALNMTPATTLTGTTQSRFGDSVASAWLGPPLRSTSTPFFSWTIHPG